MQSREEWIKSQCSGTILDVGSADGWVFKGSGLDITYLDINEFPPGEFPQIVADAHNLPLGDGSFDCCVLAEILEHVHNPILVLKEAARVARKKVIFTVPDEYHWTPNHLPLKTLNDLIGERHQTPEQIYREGNPSNIKLNDLKQSFHNRWYTKEVLESHLKYLGLPYQIQTIAYDGWSWFCGTILKTAPELERVQKASEVGAVTLPETTLDSPMLENAAIKYQAEAHPRSLHIDTFPKDKFVQANAENLPFSDKQFDVAVATELLEHVGDPVAVLREIKRVARRAIITVPNEYDWAPEYRPFAASPHVRFYTNETLKQHLEEAGIGKYKFRRLDYDGWSQFAVVIEEEGHGA